VGYEKVLFKDCEKNLLLLDNLKKAFSNLKIVTTIKKGGVT
jgi:hypothetical protein